jgi:hypothetical protein
MEATIMWIITKLSGVISADAVTRFTENSFGTYAHCGATSHLLSDQKILTTIVEALKSGCDFLEVE